MAVGSKITVESGLEDLAERMSWYAILADLIRRKPLGAAGGVIVIIMLIAGVFAPVFAPFDPVINDYSRPHFAPNLTNLLPGIPAFPKQEKPRQTTTELLSF